MFEHHSQHQMHIGHGNSPYFADTLTCFSGHLGLFHQFFCFHEVTSFSTRHAFKLFQTKSPFDGSWSVLLCYLILSYCPFLFALMMPNWLTHLVSWVSIRKSWNLKRDSVWFPATNFSHQSWAIPQADLKSSELGRLPYGAVLLQKEPRWSYLGKISVCSIFWCVPYSGECEGTIIIRLAADGLFYSSVLVVLLHHIFVGQRHIVLLPIISLVCKHDHVCRS